MPVAADFSADHRFGKLNAPMALLKKIACAGSGLALGYLASKAFAGSAQIRQNKGSAIGRTFVIVGAGFAGVAVASELARLLPDPANGDIVLIDEDDFLLFTPMLTEVVGDEVDARHIIYPVKHVSERIRFIRGIVTGVDPDAKTVDVRTGGTRTDSARYRLHADQIVIAIGSTTNFHDIPGLADTALPVKKLEDASAIFDRIVGCLERASIEEDPGRRTELLTFVVAGGGYAGVETMAAVNDLVRDRIRGYPNIASENVRTILINPGNRLLTEITSDLAAYAEGKLRERGVEIKMNTKVSGATTTYVALQGGDRIHARTLIWAAGEKPNPLVEPLACEKGRHGRIKVTACCEVPDHKGIWALGDCAEIPHANRTGSYAPTAQNATREGKLVARNMIAALHGQRAEPFDYTPVGELALVGKHSGVARVYGHNFSGPLAWAMWRAIYLAKMPGTGQKARILSDWVLDLVFGRNPIAIDSRRLATRERA